MPTYDLERDLRSRGYAVVCGVDEAGRGPLCGPVVAAACILPDGLDIPELTKVFMRLQALGMDVPAVYTMEQALAALTEILTEL